MLQEAAVMLLKCNPAAANRVKDSVLVVIQIHHRRPYYITGELLTHKQ